MLRIYSQTFQCLLDIALVVLFSFSHFLSPYQATAQNTLSITDFGAVPNDGNDDTFAIQAAIASTQPGDTVVVPAGTFNVSQSLILGTTNVTLAGVSQAESVLEPMVAGPTFFNPIILSGVSNSVRHLTIDGKNTDGFANGIRVGGAGATMDQITIRDLNTSGFQHGIYALQANDVTVSNSTFENIHVNSVWGAAIRFQSGNGAHFFGNTVRNTGRGGFFINDINGIGSTDISIHDNVIENSGLAPGGISMAIELGPYTERAVVENNTVDHWISVGPIAEHVAVRRNQIGDTRYTLSYGLEAAGGTTNVVFTDNTVTGGVQHGLLIANINTKEHMLFRNNVFEGASEMGMLIQGDAPPISKSYFYQNTVAENQYAGIQVSQEVHHITFDENIIQDNQGHGVILVGNALNALSFEDNQILDNSGYSISGTFPGPDLEWSNNTIAGNLWDRNLTSQGFSTNAKPTLSFTSEVDGTATTTVNVGEAVNFIPQFSDPDLGDSMSAILWDFDFGFPLDETSPTVIFTAPGNYRVTSVAWDQAGRGALAEQSVTVLSAPPVVPGDFDSNGAVDGFDFLAWQLNPEIGNLADWSLNYGQESGFLSETSNAVPEPAPGAILLTFLLSGAALSCDRLIRTRSGM